MEGIVQLGEVGKVELFCEMTRIYFPFQDFHFFNFYTIFDNQDCIFVVYSVTYGFILEIKWDNHLREIIPCFPTCSVSCFSGCR